MFKAVLILIVSLSFTCIAEDKAAGGHGVGQPAKPITGLFVQVLFQCQDTNKKDTTYLTLSEDQTTKQLLATTNSNAGIKKFGISSAKAEKGIRSYSGDGFEFFVDLTKSITKDMLFGGALNGQYIGCRISNGLPLRTAKLTHIGAKPKSPIAKELRATGVDMKGQFTGFMLVEQISSPSGPVEKHSKFLLEGRAQVERDGRVLYKLVENVSKNPRKIEFFDNTGKTGRVPGPWVLQVGTQQYRGSPN